MTDITEIKRALTSRAPEVAAFLLPKGVLDKREWCAGSVHGEAGQSLKVAVSGHKMGIWSDFAPGGEGGDLIDLWSQVKQIPLTETLDEIRDWLGMERPKFQKREREYRRPEKPRCQVPKSAVLEYLTGRAVTEDAIRAYRVAENGRTVVFPSLLPNGTLAFVKHLAIDLKPSGKKDMRVEADCEPVLFGWQVVDAYARECTITEGEIDTLSAWDYGVPSPMSVPFGGGKGDKQRWIESDYDRLLRFEVIFIATDMDAEGDAAAEEIAMRLGRHRCRRVKLPLKDLNECRKAGVSAEDIAACFAAARTLDPEELMRAGDFTDQVIEQFWPGDDRPAGYATPFGSLGQKLLFRPGEMSLWTGATGAGKSQVLSHAIVHAGSMGARVCVASLEMQPAVTLKRMVKQAGNVDRPTEKFIRETIGWVDQWLWFYAQVGKAKVGRLLEIFEYARCRYGCDVFVIDSLMRLGIGGEDYEGQEKAVFEVVSWAVDKAVHVHLVAHARKADRSRGAAEIPDAEDVKGTSEIAANAANVIGVWRNRKLEDKLAIAERAAESGHPDAVSALGELRSQAPVMLHVAKQRNGNFEGKVGLWFSKETYQYRSSGDDRWGRQYVESEHAQAAE